MRNISMEELAIIIENHKHYLYEDGDGWETMQADLRGANIRDADLSYVNLEGADLGLIDLSGTNLSGADLSGADLSRADLRYADLRGANLRGANLSMANLSMANLNEADLFDADLRYADLRVANLRFANLSDADLSFADLGYTDLSYTDLRGTDLRGADLRGADLRGATLLKGKNVPYIPMICPEEGSFIGYKKASNKIVKLLIPEDAKRSSATTRQCRCDRAIVLAIYELDGSVSKVTEVSSDRNHNFIYKINKEVVVDDFDDDRWNECSTGIHFFMQKHEAMNYQS